MIYTLYFFVPGKDWRMTTINEENLQNAQDAVVEYLKQYDGCTHVRLYDSEPIATGYPNSMSWRLRAAVGEGETPR